MSLSDHRYIRTQLKNKFDRQVGEYTCVANTKVGQRELFDPQHSSWSVFDRQKKHGELWQWQRLTRESI